jgi:ABC-type polysaccharide/polyol phosphate transport system ATPase subunit
MSDAIITVENLSKSYLVGHKFSVQSRSNYTALRDVIGREVRNAARKTMDVVRGRQVLQGDEVEEFWALKDISFEVSRGEVLGIIGKNGAGKSTILKILSRITDPTKGRITLRGRVASLLEVGTGFHPELTGRENIYLNGAILGMTRAEIRGKFDEIVAFAEVEKFLDTPVKHYSSGMYVRLAFAVAAHLEPEILIIDEVLAVGDAEFQKKCLGKMGEVSHREGRTVLFVSHNMAAIAELSSRAIFLESGSLVIDDQTSKTLSTYLSRRTAEAIYASSHDEWHESPHIARAEVLTSRPDGVQHADEPLEIKVWVRHARPLVRGCLGVQIINQLQVAAIAVYAYPPDCEFGVEPGTTLIQFNISKLRVNSGHFHLRIWLTQALGEAYEKLDGVCSFEVTRLERDIVRSWPVDACIYHEEFSVRITDNAADVSKSQAKQTIDASPISGFTK